MTGETPISTWRDRWNGSAEGMIVLDLGEQPPSDLFPAPDDPTPDPVQSLRMVFGSASGLLQLEDDPTSPTEVLGVEPIALIRQAESSVAEADAAGLIVSGSRVRHYPSPHGGSWRPQLERFELVEVQDGTADLIVDVHGMMHDADQRAGFMQRADQLADDGVLLFLIHDAAAVVRLGMWNVLKTGHFAYYTVPSLVAMAEELGLVGVGAWTYPLYQNGTTMLAFARAGGRFGDEHSADVAALVSAGLGAGVLDPGRVEAALQHGFASSVAAIRSYLDRAAAEGLVVAGYGAASRTSALLTAAKVTPGDLALIADAAVNKHGLTMPGSRVPIGSPAALVALRPDRVLLFVSDLLPEVRAALPGVEATGGRWVVVDPIPVEVEPEEA